MPIKTFFICFVVLLALVCVGEVKRVQASQMEVYEAYLDHWGVRELGEFQTSEFSEVAWRSVYASLPQLTGFLRRGEDLWTSFSDNIMLVHAGLSKKYYRFVFRDDPRRDVAFLYVAMNLSKTQARIATHDESIAGHTAYCATHYSVLMERPPDGKWRFVHRF